MKCELCQITHNGEYGSGRFCSNICARSYSTAKKRKEINERVSKTMSGKLWGQAKYTKGKLLVENIVVECNNPMCNKTFSKRPWLKKKYCNAKCASYKNGGLRPNCGKKGCWYFCTELNRNVYLDSTWELEYAQFLDRKKIKWIRPGYLSWIDCNDKLRKYYPDFLLVESNTYQDVKNDYLIIKDSEKIRLVEEQNNVKIEILSRKNLDDLLE